MLDIQIDEERNQRNIRKLKEYKDNKLMELEEEQRKYANNDGNAGGNDQGGIYQTAK